VAVGGALILRFYKPIADNLSGGIASYNKWKIVGLVCAGVGILMMFN
jgi:hypothetical protein